MDKKENLKSAFDDLLEHKGKGFLLVTVYDRETEQYYTDFMASPDVTPLQVIGHLEQFKADLVDISKQQRKLD